MANKWGQQTASVPGGVSKDGALRLRRSVPFVGKKDGSYNYWASESRAPAFALHLASRPREKQVSKPGPSNLIDGAKQAAKQGTDGYSLNMTFFTFLFAPSLLNSIPLPLPGRGCFCLSKLLSICSSPSWLPFPTWRRQVGCCCDSSKGVGTAELLGDPERTTWRAAKWRASLRRLPTPVLGPGDSPP